MTDPSIIEQRTAHGQQLADWHRRHVAAGLYSFPAMLNNDHLAALAYEAAGRRPDLPRRAPGRAARIAAVHMFADWLVAHPEIPVPQEIIGTYFVRPADEADQALRYAAVRTIADQLGESEYGSDCGDRSAQVDCTVAERAVHGVRIVYRAAALSDDFYSRRL